MYVPTLESENKVPFRPFRFSTFGIHRRMWLPPSFCLSVTRTTRFSISPEAFVLIFLGFSCFTLPICASFSLYDRLGSILPTQVHQFPPGNFRDCATGIPTYPSHDSSWNGPVSFYVVVALPPSLAFHWVGAFLPRRGVDQLPHFRCCCPYCQSFSPFHTRHC